MALRLFRYAAGYNSDRPRCHELLRNSIDSFRRKVDAVHMGPGLYGQAEEEVCSCLHGVSPR